MAFRTVVVVLFGSIIYCCSALENPIRPELHIGGTLFIGIGRMRAALDMFVRPPLPVARKACKMSPHQKPPAKNLPQRIVHLAAIRKHIFSFSETLHLKFPQRIVHLASMRKQNVPF